MRTEAEVRAMVAELDSVDRYYDRKDRTIASVLAALTNVLRGPLGSIGCHCQGRSGACPCSMRSLAMDVRPEPVSGQFGAIADALRESGRDDMAADLLAWAAWIERVLPSVAIASEDLRQGDVLMKDDMGYCHRCRSLPSVPDDVWGISSINRPVGSVLVVWRGQLS
jgi:hypothetical protein